jgi:hypothetical protein
MSKIKLNHTRYATEDLQQIIDAAMVHVQTKQQGQKSSRTDAPLLVEYRYGTKDGKLVSLGKTTLKLASLTDLWVAYPLHGIGSVEGMVHLPSQVNQQLGDVILEWGLRWGFKHSQTQPPYGKLQQQLAKIMVRILPEVVDKKPPSRKLSADERMVKLMERCGPGGKLDSVGMEYDRWSEKIKDGRIRYERELAYRDKYRSKILQAGGFVQPYETFADYLRRTALEIDGIDANEEEE